MKKVTMRVKVNSDAVAADKKNKAAVDPEPAGVAPKDKDGNPAIPPITE
jgi:hypothetical protein